MEIWCRALYLCRSYSGPDRPSKKKEAFRPSKAVMREHEGAQFIWYRYNRGHSPIFFHFREKPDLKNLEIGPTILDIWWLVKIHFDRVSDRNVRNGKTPVIWLASTLPELQLVHYPPHSLAVSKQNAGECMFPGGYRACPWRKFAIAYVRAPLLLI